MALASYDAGRTQTSAGGRFMTEPRMASAHRRIYNSPLPDVEVPDLPLTTYVLRVAPAIAPHDVPTLVQRYHW